jgi:hypothetical protein
VLLRYDVHTSTADANTTESFYRTQTLLHIPNEVFDRQR